MLGCANANPGADTITFANNVAGGTVTLSIAGANEDASQSGDLDIASEITIEGAGTTIDAAGIDRVLNVLSGAKLTLNDATITGGSADIGGGIRISRGSAFINRSTISGNTASLAGGGILSSNTSTVVISDSTLSDNMAFQGGGANLQDTNASITNSTISENVATDNGGGLSLVGGTFQIVHSTIVGNSAGTGGGIVRSQGTVTVANSIVTANTAATGPDVNGTFSSNGHNVIGSTAGSTGFGAGDNVGTPASQIVNLTLANNGGPTKTHALIASLSNPAINTGESLSGINADQRGVLRPFGSGGDIGAFEGQYPLPSLNPQSQTKTAGETVTFTALADGLFAGSAPSMMAGGAILFPGQFLLSANRGYQLIYQNDGNLVLYRGDGVALWSTQTAGLTPGRVEMRTDGDLVVYGPGDVVQFATGTSGNPGAALVLQDDGNLVILGSSGLLFASGTAASQPNVVPTVQWQVSTDGGANFNDIPGATDLALSFVTLLADNNKQYRARFSNAFASNLPTQAALLTVTGSDVTPPTVVSFTRQDPAAAITNADLLQFRVAFSEQVLNVDPSDFVVNGATTAGIVSVVAVQGTGEAVYLITVSGGDLASFNGPVGVDLSSGNDITDAALNALVNQEPLLDELYTLDNIAPQVSGPIVINDGSAQRSMVRSITVNFDSAIVFQTGAFDLRTAGGQLINVATSVAPGTVTNQVVLTFPGQLGGSLLDGNYRLTLIGGLIFDVAGNTLDGDANGSAGGNRVDDFFRFFGDYDGDGDVDRRDYAFFQRAYKDPGNFYDNAFDVDTDGDIDRRDYAFFQQNYGKTLGN